MSSTINDYATDGYLVAEAYGHGFALFHLIHPRLAEFDLSPRSLGIGARAWNKIRLIDSQGKTVPGSSIINYESEAQHEEATQ